jgi:hypothetical protein
MKQTVNEWDFIEAFRQAGREENFTREGLSALFKEFEDFEDSTGEEIELDVIAICCDYTEYSNFAEFNADYKVLDDDEIAELLEENDIEDIEDITVDMVFDTISWNTILIPVDDYSFIIQRY